MRRNPASRTPPRSRGSKVRVLVACEFSGIVRDAFIARGHDAISCDLLPSERGYPHIQDDVRDILQWPGNEGRWDLMIAHPPCTYLASSGARWMKERLPEQERAVSFFRQLMTAPIPMIAGENPIGRLSTLYRKPDQIIQPWQFGEPETKATCLWLKNLPKLVPTKIIPEAERKHSTWREPPGPERWKNRSRTFKGIAEAMADQWGREAEEASR
jgi:hypothetical protein